MSSQPSLKQLLLRASISLLGLGISSCISYFIVNRIMNPPPDRSALSVAAAHVRRKRPSFNFASLTHNEQIIAASAVDAADVHVSFADIGGLDAVAAKLRQLVVLPFIQSSGSSSPVSSLLRPPTGILLYGPPGTGKSMLAKAIAAESQAFFINVDSSITRSKWFGESEKLLAAVFSLAQKLQPCIIFVDEMDSFLRKRSSDESEHSAAIKGLWLQLWDGLGSSNGGVIVIGATNRPWDIDPAIQRRMPRTFHVELPGELQRSLVLQKMLRHEQGLKDNAFLLKGLCDEISKMTPGYSGSDLKELCAAAMQQCVAEDDGDGGDLGKTLNLKHFEAACMDVRATGAASREFYNNSKLDLD